MEARAQLGIAGGLKYPQSQSVGGGYAYSRSSINSPPLSNLPDDVLEGVDREKMKATLESSDAVNAKARHTVIEPVEIYIEVENGT